MRPCPKSTCPACALLRILSWQQKPAAAGTGTPHFRALSPDTEWRFQMLCTIQWRVHLDGSGRLLRCLEKNRAKAARPPGRPILVDVCLHRAARLIGQVCKFKLKRIDGYLGGIRGGQSVSPSPRRPSRWPRVQDSGLGQDRYEECLVCRVQVQFAVSGLACFAQLLKQFNNSRYQAL